MGSAKSHLGDEVEQAFTDVNSSIKIIHGGLTHRSCSFWITGWTELYVDCMWKYYKWVVLYVEIWLVCGEVEFMETGNRKPASYKLVPERVDCTQKRVATDELIKKGFRQCGYIEYDYKTSNLHSRLQETRSSKGGIQRINEFLEEMIALQLDEESPDEKVILSQNCTANVNENDAGESDEDNYGEENDGVESDDDEISLVDLQ